MTRRIVIALALAGLFAVMVGPHSSVAVGAEKCPLGLCKGDRVIVYDSNHKRTGTIENRGYGKIQTRDNRNRITGYIDGQGRTYDKNHARTGSIGEPRSTAKPWWR